MSNRLAEIQQWMQAVITHPGGVRAGLDSAETRAILGLGAEDVDSLIEPSQRRTSIERLAVYGNAYFARLVDCLREEFPAMRYALGDEAFDGLGFNYLCAYPSTSYTLADLSENFPRYLSEMRPADEPKPSWPDFLIDLARLERLYSEVFDGPGIERIEPLSAESLASIPVESWANVRLRPAPCLRLMAFDFPVHEYATAVRRGVEPDFPLPAPTWLAVSRIDYIVRRWPLSAIPYRLLSSIVEGKPLGDAIAVAAEGLSEREFKEFSSNLRPWFEEWATVGFFTAID